MIERLPVFPPEVKEVADLVLSFRSVENNDPLPFFVNGTVLEAPASLEKPFDRI